MATLLHDRNILLRVARRCGAWRPIVSRMMRMRYRVGKGRTLNGWKFPPRSSGPFGEETPGRWQERHRAEKRWVLRLEVKTFVNAFVRLPCQVVRTGRKLVYRLLSWNQHQRVFDDTGEDDRRNQGVE